MSSKHKSHKPTAVDTQHAMPRIPRSSSLPRAVHFPSDASLVSSASRPMNDMEQCAFLSFEIHCLKCRTHCHDSYNGYKSGRHLCKDGAFFAQSISTIVYRKNDEIYSKEPSFVKPKVRIEHDHSKFRDVRQMLKLVAKHGQRAIDPQRKYNNWTEDSIYDCLGQRHNHAGFHHVHVPITAPYQDYSTYNMTPSAPHIWRPTKQHNRSSSDPVVATMGSRNGPAPHLFPPGFWVSY